MTALPFGHDAERRQEMADWAADLVARRRDVANAREAAGAAAPPARPPSEAKLTREAALRSLRRRSSLRKEPSLPSRFAFALEQTADNRCMRALPDAKQAAVGTRLVDIGLLTTHVIAKLPCAFCRKLGTLTLAAEHEARCGLASEFGLFCSSCQAVAGELPTSLRLPSTNRGQKAALVNVRAALGAANAGLGRSAISRLMASLDVPTVGVRSYRKADRLVRDACITVGTKAKRQRREARRRRKQRDAPESSGGKALIEAAGYRANAAWDSDSEGSEDEAQPQDAEEESEGKESPPPQQRTRRAQRSAAGSSAGVVSYTVSLQSQVVRSDPYNHYTLLYPSLACARRAARVPAGLPRAAAGAWGWACRPGARLGLRSADWPRAACRVRLSSLFTLFLGSHRISGQGSSIL